MRLHEGSIKSWESSPDWTLSGLSTIQYFLLCIVEFISGHITGQNSTWILCMGFLHAFPAWISCMQFLHWFLAWISSMDFLHNVFALISSNVLSFASKVLASICSWIAACIFALIFVWYFVELYLYFPTYKNSCGNPRGKFWGYFE